MCGERRDTRASSASSRSGPGLRPVETVEMSGCTAWAEFANLHRQTRTAAPEHERAKTEV
jgi:hypothetical protein